MRKEALSSLMDMALSEDNHEALAFLIMDSLKEAFPRDQQGQPIDWPSEADFLDHPKMDIPTLIQGAMGVLKANKGVLGPFEEHLDTLIQVAKEKLNEVMDLPTPSENSKEPTSGSQTEDSTEVSDT